MDLLQPIPAPTGIVSPTAPCIQESVVAPVALTTRSESSKSKCDSSGLRSAFDAVVKRAIQRAREPLSNRAIPVFGGGGQQIFREAHTAVLAAICAAEAEPSERTLAVLRKATSRLQAQSRP